MLREITYKNIEISFKENHLLNFNNKNLDNCRGFDLGNVL